MFRRASLKASAFFIPVKSEVSRLWQVRRLGNRSVFRLHCKGNAFFLFSKEKLYFFFYYTIFFAGVLRPAFWTDGAHQPPATSHQPPATSHQPPATSHQPPATSHQPPAPATSHQAAGHIPRRNAPQRTRADVARRRVFFCFRA